MEDICVIATRDIPFKDPPIVLISTSVHIQTEAVLTSATTRLVRIHVHVPAEWSWILGREAAKTSMNVHHQMEAVNILASTLINPTTASVGKDTL